MELRNNNKIVILSPHLDDAVLSLGSHIVKWQREGKKITVITIFTRFESKIKLPRYSWEYIKKSGFDSVKKFELARNKEDRLVMEGLGVRYKYWNFIDAGFRGWYKTKESLMGGIINYRDKKLVKNIRAKISSIKTDLILVPFGVGGHVDHIILKEATKEIKIKNYYLDVPYLWHNFNYIKLFFKIIFAKSVLRDDKKKHEIFQNYASQYNLIMRENNFFAEVIV